MKEMIEPTARYMSFEEVLDRDGVLIYTNVGTSMMPLIRQRRDIIEIRRKDPSARCRKYDAVLYKRGNKYILHRIIKVRRNDYVIVGDHCIQKEYGITDDQILGVLKRVIRDGKSITPDDPAYKLYVHLWCDFYHIRAAILYSKIIIHAVLHKIKQFVLRCVKKDGNAQ